MKKCQYKKNFLVPFVGKLQKRIKSMLSFLNSRQSQKLFFLASFVQTLNSF